MRFSSLICRLWSLVRKKEEKEEWKKETAQEGPYCLAVWSLKTERRASVSPRSKPALAPPASSVPLPLHEERGSERNDRKGQGQNDRRREKEGERKWHLSFSIHSDVLRVLRVACRRPRRIRSLDLPPPASLSSTLPSARFLSRRPTTYSSTTLTVSEFRAIAAGRHQHPNSWPKRRSSVASNKDPVG